MTDADCEPASDNWIREMMKSYTDGKEIVLGYGAYMKEPLFINKWIRFETAFNSMLFLNYALGRNAYMGVGRNLAYRKSLFFRTKGFARHYHLISGDDDLFVNENATASNTAIEFHADSFTYSDPRKTFSEWFIQKLRHIGTGRFYKFKHKLLLFMNSFSAILFYLTFIALLILRYDWRIILSLYVIKILIEFPVVYASSKRMRTTDLVWVFPLLEFFMALLQPLFFFSNLVTKQKPWK